MRNSNPSKSLVSAQRQILISTPCLPCNQLVVTSSTGPILVFPWIHPLGCDDPFSRGRKCSRQVTAWNCVRCPVPFRHEILSISNNTQESCIHTNFNNLSCCESLSIRTSYCRNGTFWYAGSSLSKKKKLLSWLSLSTVDCLSHHFLRSPWSIVKGIHILHTFPRLLRKDWPGLQNQSCENCPNFDSSGPKMNRQLSMSLAFEFSSRQWGRSPPFSIISRRCESSICHTFFLSFVPQKMSFNIDMNRRILPVKFSGMLPNLLSKSLNFPQSCNVSNPGKMFHSNSVGSPLIPSKFL